MADAWDILQAHQDMVEAAEEAQERREKEVVACDECGTEVLKDDIEAAVDAAERHDEQRHNGERTTTVNGILPPEFSDKQKQDIQDAVQKLRADTSTASDDLDNGDNS